MRGRERERGTSDKSGTNNYANSRRTIRSVVEKVASIRTYPFRKLNFEEWNSGDETYGDTTALSLSLSSRFRPREKSERNLFITRIVDIFYVPSFFRSSFSNYKISTFISWQSVT